MEAVALLRLNPLIGRDDVLRRSLEAIGQRRLISITGPGGIGKTRLAAEIAWELRSRSVVVESVLAASLDSNSSLTARIEDILTRLWVDEATADVPAASSAASAGVLIIDNLEHLLPAAVDVVLDMFGEFDGTVVVTSRTPLDIAGEFVVRLPPLSLEVSRIGEMSPAAEMLIGQLSDQTAGLTPELGAELRAHVEEIAAACNGVPLAIELIAGRIGRIGIDVDRWRADGEAAVRAAFVSSSRGGRTVESMFTWSADHLPADQRQALERLAVLPGGGTVETFSAIWETTPDRAIDLLDEFIRLSMVFRDDSAGDDGVRFRLLEPLRHLCLEWLSGRAGELDRVIELLFGFVADLAAEFNRTLGSDDNGRAWVELEGEATNAMSALRWAASHGWRPEAAADIVEAMYHVALEDDGLLPFYPRYATDPAVSPIARVRLARYGSFAAVSHGDRDGAARLVSLCHSMAAEHDQLVLRALAHSADAIFSLMSGDTARADEQLERFAETGGAGLRIVTLTAAVARATLLRHLGRFDDAYAVLLAPGVRDCVSDVVQPNYANGLGLIALDLGRWAEALEQAESILDWAAKRQSDDWAHHAREILAGAMIGEGRLDDARVVLEQQDLSAPHLTQIVAQAGLRSQLALGRGDVDEAVRQADRAMTASLRLAEREYQAIALAAAGAAALATRDERAAAHLRAAIRIAGTFPLCGLLADLIELLAIEADHAGDHARLHQLLGAAAHARHTGAAYRSLHPDRGRIDRLAAAAEPDGTWFEAGSMRLSTTGLGEVLGVCRPSRSAHRPANVPSFGRESLTPAELGVVGLVAAGLRNKQIAARQGVSIRTVEAHLSHIFTKLNTSSRTELALLAATWNDGR